jgi:superfamily II DNA or RNA helicase
LRLGLSATPYDQFDGHADDRYLDRYFGSVVFEFSLKRAIDEGFLTKYKFHFFCCSLNNDETELYEYLTQRIVQIAGSEEKISPETWARVQQFMLARARVVGAAQSKLTTLSEHLTTIGKVPYTLFYCGDGSVVEGDLRQRQVERVSELLGKLGWNSSRITAAESLKTREALLERLSNRGIDAIVSIKVLDEGIDIPACQRAYLLASQSSDRQGVQRRGRILRRSKGKEQADLYDFIVIRGASSSKVFLKLATKEIRRAYQFAKDAVNSREIVGQLEQLQISLGLKPEDPNDRFE